MRKILKELFFCAVLFFVCNVNAQINFSNRLVFVSAIEPVCMEVNDKHGVLVVGTKAADEQLMVYKLNDDGLPSEQVVQKITYKKHDSLAAFTLFTGGLAFHPSLPLLYVWRDIKDVKAGSADEKNVFNYFEHAGIYEITNGSLKEVLSFASGSNYMYGIIYGTPPSYSSFAVDYTGHRLFVPNLRDPSNGQTAIGYFDLDDKGMPVPLPVPIPGTLDGYGVNKYEKKLIPVWINVHNLRPYVSGLGMVAPSPTTMVFSASQGFGLWDTENRMGNLGYFAIVGVGDHWICSHPSLNTIFGAVINSHLLLRIMHSDGYFTMMPQLKWSLSGMQFQCRPVVIPGKPAYLAIGGTAQIVIHRIDAEEKLTDEGMSIIGCALPIKALAWSERFKRLYALVESKQ